MGLFDKLKRGMSKTRENISSKINTVISTFTHVDEELLEELEEMLILCDMGAQASSLIIEQLRERVKSDKLKDVEDVKSALVEIIEDILTYPPEEEVYPKIILIVGVNGVGKTTTIGKLAHMYKSDGKSVLLAAADTFRAAAAEQLTIWSERAGVPIIKYGEGHDPAAVVYDAIDSAKHRGTDVVICDTAGRLHNKKNLMGELSKISRVIDKEFPKASRETYLVLDSTTGQNAVTQAKQFAEASGITGIVLTKLDGTAKGGVVCAIASELQLPVRYVGVGEGMDDLQPFAPRDFAEALIQS